jgi:hypothetical protein
MNNELGLEGEVGCIIGPTLHTERTPPSLTGNVWANTYGISLTLAMTEGGPKYGLGYGQGNIGSSYYHFQVNFVFLNAIYDYHHIEADNDCYGIEFVLGKYMILPLSFSIGYLRNIDDDKGKFYISFGLGF